MLLICIMHRYDQRKSGICLLQRMVKECKFRGSFEINGFHVVEDKAITKDFLVAKSGSGSLGQL